MSLCAPSLVLHFSFLTLNIPRGVLWGPPLVGYWLTSVEINKHKIFDSNNAWITELEFQKPKKHNLSNLSHHTVEKLQKNHGVLRGPQLGKQRWRPRLGILRVNRKFCGIHSRYTQIMEKWKSFPLKEFESQTFRHVTQPLYQLRYSIPFLLNSQSKFLNSVQFKQIGNM